MSFVNDHQDVNFTLVKDHDEHSAKNVFYTCDTFFESDLVKLFHKISIYEIIYVHLNIFFTCLELKYRKINTKAKVLWIRAASTSLERWPN